MDSTFSAARFLAMDSAYYSSIASQTTFSPVGNSPNLQPSTFTPWSRWGRSSPNRGRTRERVTGPTSSWPCEYPRLEIGPPQTPPANEVDRNREKRIA